MPDQERDPESDAPGNSSEVVEQPPETWAGLRASAAQAMEWGIELCGQLATVHREGIVVSDIRPDTIVRSRFGQPSLPEPDARAVHAEWVDVAALASAIGALVADQPPELANALLPPYASAVALGQELQDAQAAMGLPVAPIPFDDAPPVLLGGYPTEVSPDLPDPTRPAAAAAATDGSDETFDPAELARNPNLKALLAIAVLVGVLAIVFGVGWR